MEKLKKTLTLAASKNKITVKKNGVEVEVEIDDQANENRVKRVEGLMAKD